MNKVLVTGANGFVGRQLYRTLSEHGFAVQATVRSANTPLTQHQPLVVGDIGPETDWTKALQGLAW